MIIHVVTAFYRLQRVLIKCKLQNKFSSIILDMRLITANKIKQNKVRQSAPQHQFYRNVKYATENMKFTTQQF